MRSQIRLVLLMACKDRKSKGAPVFTGQHHQQPAPADAATETFGALPFASMISIFQSGELMKYSPVGLDNLLQTES